MVKIIMHGCNGHMGQVITGLVKEDANAEIIAGIDMNDNGQNCFFFCQCNDIGRQGDEKRKSCGI